MSCGCRKDPLSTSIGAFENTSTLRMSKSWPIPRRTFLKGLGTAIALPVLESMMPRMSAAASGAAVSKPLPKRMAFVYVPNGANIDDWTALGVGAEFELPYILEPLKGHQRELLVLSG